ncbi:hypothetical protein PoB_004070600 [Plakobranchus ocellatus]|uniref:Uncharacterized protein n=1 Tax=Plakobranchus ocellatus TaxID=259542 RepID=A0AAV4ASW6_9GAST|nr:hypothetical protein PoB_004070600 [Plakobranchus ocellatus]
MLIQDQGSDEEMSLSGKRPAKVKRRSGQESSSLSAVLVSVGDHVPPQIPIFDGGQYIKNTLVLNRESLSQKDVCKISKTVLTVNISVERRYQLKGKRILTEYFGL